MAENVVKSPLLTEAPGEAERPAGAMGEGGRADWGSDGPGRGPPSQEEEPGTRSAPGEQRPLRVARGAGSAARWAGDARKAEGAPRAEPRAGAAGPGEGTACAKP